MKYLAFTLVLLGTGVCSNVVLGNGMIVVPINPQAARGEAPAYAAPASARSGFLSRFHGKHHGNCPPTGSSVESASSRGTAAAAPTAAMISDPTRPCYQSNAVTVDARGLVTSTPGHCFPNCYTGTPCKCCDHHITYLRPNSPRGRAYIALAQQNAVVSTPVAYPPLVHRLLRKHPQSQ